MAGKAGNVQKVGPELDDKLVISRREGLKKCIGRLKSKDNRQVYCRRPLIREESFGASGY